MLYESDYKSTIIVSTAVRDSIASPDRQVLAYSRRGFECDFMVRHLFKFL